MDSDSDSDDDLLLSSGPAFKTNRRQQNREARAKEQQNAILNKALQNCDRMAEYARRLSLAKQQGENDDEDGDDEEAEPSGSKEPQPPSRGASSSKTPARNGTPASLGGMYDLDGKDQDEVLPIERRRQLAKAYATEGSSCLGTRMIISFDMKKYPTLPEKSATPEEAIQLLEQILSNFEKENSASSDIDNIVKSLRVAIDLSVLPDFLMEKRLVRKFCTKSPSVDEASLAPLLTQLTAWLYDTATSVGLMMASKLPQGAILTLVELVKKGKLPVNMQQTPISHLLSQLLCWVNANDFLPDMDTKVSAKDSENSETDAASMPMDIDNPQLSTNNNETGLLNLLLFWEQLIPIWSPSPVFDTEAASTVMVVLCRLGIDSMAVSNHNEMYLFPLLQRVVSAMLDRIASHFYKVANGNESQGKAALEEWMDKTVQLVFQKDLNQVGRRLGMNDKNASDEDDDKASLCYASTVRLIPIHLQDGKAEETHKLSVEFKARLAIRALEILCDDGGDSQSASTPTIIQGFSTGEATQLAKREMSQLAWTAYSAVLVALGRLNGLGENISRQGPKSLATVECISMLFETVLILLNGAARGWDKDEYSPEQAHVAVEMLHTMDRETEKLNKHVKRNTMANSHARRMDHHFSCFIQYYRIMWKRALRLTGDVEKIERQSKITDFCLSSP
jgi:hypothetical protein